MFQKDMMYLPITTSLDMVQGSPGELLVCEDRLYKNIPKFQCPNQLSWPKAFPNAQIKGVVEASSGASYAKDYVKARSNLLPIAHDPVAQCSLGLIQFDDPSQDAMRDIGWENLLSSAETGFEYAWYALAIRYFDLEKTSHNLEQASRWFLKAVELGCRSSQYSLGWCLCNLEEYVEATK